MATNANGITTEFDSDFHAFLLQMDASLNRPNPRPDPLAPILPAALFDNSRELSAALAGRPAAAEQLRRQRYLLFREWLCSLAERKTELQRARLASRSVSFAEIVRFEASVRSSLAVLRLAGELHFRAIRSWEPLAIAAAERIAVALRPPVVAAGTPTMA